MLILLPPSEGKSVPPTGAPVDLESLSFPELTATRTRVLAALVSMCQKDPDRAAAALGLGPKQGDAVVRNVSLRTAATAAAMDVYSGVLYDSLDYSNLPRRATTRASSELVVASALWGLTRPDDRIPAYRLSGSTVLPTIGTMRQAWRSPLSAVLAGVDDFIIDLRSGTYRQLAPPPAGAANWVSIRVLQERDGRRVTVSHFNKATKGRIARDLISSRRHPTSAATTESALISLSYRCEQSAEHPSTIDVIVTDL